MYETIPLMRTCRAVSLLGIFLSVSRFLFYPSEFSLALALVNCVLAMLNGQNYRRAVRKREDRREAE